MFGLLLSPITRLFHLILGVGTAQNFPPPLDSAEEEQAFRLSRNHPDPAVREEARQKLIKIDPETLAQASRIPGISPSDINVLLVLLGR